MDCKGHRLEITVGTRVAAAADNTVLREQRPDQNIQMRVASVEEESGVWLWAQMPSLPPDVLWVLITR